eukprot:208672_1
MNLVQLLNMIQNPNQMNQVNQIIVNNNPLNQIKQSLPYQPSLITPIDLNSISNNTQLEYSLPMNTVNTPINTPINTVNNNQYNPLQQCNLSDTQSKNNNNNNNQNNNNNNNSIMLIPISSVLNPNNNVINQQMQQIQQMQQMQQIQQQMQQMQQIQQQMQQMQQCQQINNYNGNTMVYRITTPQTPPNNMNVNINNNNQNNNNINNNTNYTIQNNMNINNQILNQINTISMPALQPVKSIDSIISPNPITDNNNAYDISIHNRSDNSDKAYKCNVCFKSFSLKQNMIIHKRIHNAEKP